MRRAPSSMIRILVFCFIILSFSHCGLFTKQAKVQYPNKVTSQMQSDFNRAENEFRNKQYPAAATLYQNYLNSYPYNRLSDEAEFRLGQIAMLDQDYERATGIFNSLAAKTPDPAVASRSRVKAGISQYRLKNDQAALRNFDKVEGQYIRRHDKIKTGGLALIILKKMGAGTEAQAYYYALLVDGYQGLSADTVTKKYGHEAPSMFVVEKELRSWAEEPASINQIDRRFLTYRGTVSRPFIDYKLGMAYYKAGNTEKAEDYLGDLVSNYSSSDLALKARPVLAELGVKAKGKSKGEKRYKVGVILPLSGKYETYGISTLNGMECAAGAKAGCTGVGNIELISRDDHGDPAAAVQAVEDLVKREKVIAIVGPLSSASAMAAAQKAQELGVVMISLAQKEGIPDVGNNIYRFSLTPNEQIKALLLYVTKKKGKKNIGVFYPNTNYGQVFLQKFKEMAGNYGAEVSASQSYKNPKKVGNELRQLKFSVSKVSEQLPLGFNALFIPDSYVAILNILPQLQNTGMENLVFLGTNAWNDPQLATLSRGKLDDSVFLDIYFKDSKNSSVQEFVAQYKTAFGQAPTTLQAMGYDVIRFLGQGLSRTRVNKPQDFKAVLPKMGGYKGVTGLHSFGQDREANVDPYMLTVKDNRIEEID